MRIMSIFFLIIVVSILINGCSRNIFLQKGQIKNNESVESVNLKNSAYQLYVASDKTNYEVGEDPFFYIKPVNDSISVNNPIKVTFTLSKPDGSVIQQNITVQNKMMCHACDPVPSDHNGCRNPCEYASYFDYADLSFGQLYGKDLGILNQKGKYKITSSSEGDILKIRKYEFEVLLSKIDSLFIGEEIAGYKLQQRNKQVWTGPYSNYQAVYLSNELRNQGSEFKKEIIIDIGLTNSTQQAFEWYNDPYGLKDKGQVIPELDGNIVFLEQEDGFVTAWPSGINVVLIEGLQKYQDNEKQFVREYLKKYPSTLKSANT